MSAKYRTREERQKETLTIIFNLKKLGYSSKEEPVRELLFLLSEYTETGEDTIIDIYHPAKRVTFRGKLYKSRYVPCEIQVVVDA